MEKNKLLTAHRQLATAHIRGIAEKSPHAQKMAVRA